MLPFALLLLAAVNPAWSRPHKPFQIAPHVYYVGTEDLGCYLITGSAGHILINTGLPGSAPMIAKSVGQLGYQLHDIRILLTMQAHFDHVGGTRAMQKLTGARVMATPADTPVLESGGHSDPTFSKERWWFDPVHVDAPLDAQHDIELGSIRLKVLPMPGHTKGSVGYEGEGVLFVNLNTVVMPMIGNQWYPSIVSDMEHSFELQESLHPTVWVAAHASQFDMDAKESRHDFNDPDGYRKAVRDSEASFRRQLAKERTTENRVTN